MRVSVTHPDQVPGWVLDQYVAHGRRAAPGASSELHHTAQLSRPAAPLASPTLAPNRDPYPYPYPLPLPLPLCPTYHKGLDDGNGYEEADGVDRRAHASLQA